MHIMYALFVQGSVEIYSTRLLFGYLSLYLVASPCYRYKVVSNERLKRAKYLKRFTCTISTNSTKLFMSNFRTNIFCNSGLVHY